MRRFTLVGVDGNAFSIIGYTARALKKAGLQDKVEEMQKKATSGNYHYLIAICDEYIDMANRALGITEDTYTEDEYEEDYI